MEHVEVRHARLFTLSLSQLGIAVLGALIILCVIVGLVVRRRGRRSR